MGRTDAWRGVTRYEYRAPARLSSKEIAELLKLLSSWQRSWIEVLLLDEENKPFRFASDSGYKVRPEQVNSKLVDRVIGGKLYRIRRIRIPHTPTRLQLWEVEKRVRCPNSS